MAKKIKGNVPDMVKEFLPEAMDTAVRSYELFLKNKINNWGEKEAFGKNHMAGKAAVAHIQMLLKLSQQLAVKESESGMSVDEIEKILETAQAEYDAYANTYEKSDGEMA